MTDLASAKSPGEAAGIWWNIQFSLKAGHKAPQADLNRLEGAIRRYVDRRILPKKWRLWHKSPQIVLTVKDGRPVGELAELIRRSPLINLDRFTWPSDRELWITPNRVEARDDNTPSNSLPWVIWPPPTH